MPDWRDTCHPDVRLVLDYWQEKCAGRLMPARADIDPGDLRRFLPHITLVDVVDDPRRFVYRLVGTSEVELRGFDPTGKSVADAYFAPVCTRLRTYALPMPPQVAAYVDRVLALTGVRAWVEGALAENDFLDFEEPYRLSR